MRMLLVLLVAIFAGNTALAATIFFTDRGADNIQRIEDDGTNQQVLVVDQPNPRGIALDVAAGKMYWTDGASDKIQRANFDGSDVEDLVTVGLVGPRQLSLNFSEGKMYWADVAPGVISRANFDGTDVELVHDGGPTQQFYGISLDEASNLVYYSQNQGDDFGLFELDLNDGIPVLSRSKVGVFFGHVRSIAFDATAGKIYMARCADGEITRINTDGTDFETIVTGLVEPEGIALDLSVGKVYWTDVGNGTIQRADLDGDNIEEVMTTGLEKPSAIAIIPEPPPPTEVPTLSEWGLIAMASILGIVGFMVMRRKKAAV